MKKKVLIAVNALLGLAMLAQAVTGLAMMLAHAHWAGELHELIGLPLIVLTAAHIILNWGWIRQSFFGAIAPRI